MILPETAAAEAARLARPRRRRPHRRQGREPRGRADGQLRARRRPRREGDGARRGHAGPSHRRRARPLRPARRRAAGVGARRQGGVEGRRSRSRGVIHTMGWPLRTRAKYREFGGSFIYPMGDDMLTIGMVVGLDYRDVELSRARPAPGAEDAPEDRASSSKAASASTGARRRSRAAASTRCRSGCTRPACCSAATASAWSTSRASRACTTRSSRAGSPPSPRSPRCSRGATPATALASYDDAVRESFICDDLHEVRDMRQVFGRGFFVGGALASAMTISKGRLDIGKMRAEPDAEQPLLRTDRAAQLPGAGRQAHLRQALVGVRVRATRRATTSRTTSASSGASRRDVAEMWVQPVPRAGLRDRRRGRRRHGHGRGRAVELRAVRRDHRQGRTPDAARGRQPGPSTRSPRRTRSAAPRALPSWTVADVRQSARSRRAGRKPSPASASSRRASRTVSSVCSRSALALGVGGDGDEQPGRDAAPRRQRLRQDRARAARASGFAAYAVWRVVQAVRTGERAKVGASARLPRPRRDLRRAHVHARRRSSPARAASSRRTRRRTRRPPSCSPGRAARGSSASPALVLIGVGLWNLYSGAHAQVRGQVARPERHRAAGAVAGVVGHVARFVVFTLIGIFAIKAAVDYNPTERRRARRRAAEARAAELRLVPARPHRRRARRLRASTASSTRATATVSRVARLTDCFTQRRTAHLTARRESLLHIGFHPDTEVPPMRTELFLITVRGRARRGSRPCAGERPGHGKIRYSFLGQLTATPSNGGVSINVEGGNKAGASRDARRAGHADVRVRQRPPSS